MFDTQTTVTFTTVYQNSRKSGCLNNVKPNNNIYIISWETCENIQFYVLPFKAAYKEPKSKQIDYAK